MTTDYQFVVAWGRLLASYPYYVREQVETARKDKAPPRATYRRDNGSWATVDECHPEIRTKLDAR